MGVSGAIHVDSALIQALFGFPVPCTLNGRPTFDWQAVVTPSGNVSMVCKFTPNSP